MKIKVCGIFRDEDIDYVNEGRPDYIGFVFAVSKRRVLPKQASRLRRKLESGIVSVGVFVNAPAAEIAALFRDGIISIAQLHGGEDGQYIRQLKELCSIPVIKTISVDEVANNSSPIPDYYLIDPGAGSGRTFDWEILRQLKTDKPWFLAGGINPDNIGAAMALEPFCIDVSSGAETNDVKDRKKILQLTAVVRQHGLKGSKNE